MLAESPFWDLGAAFRLSLWRQAESCQCLCAWGHWGGPAPGDLSAMPGNPSPAASPNKPRVPCAPSSAASGTGRHCCLGITVCGLAMAPRAGIRWGSISCLPVAPFGVNARASSQPGSQLGTGTGSREKELQPGFFSEAVPGLGTLGPHLGRAFVFECWGPGAYSHSLFLRKESSSYPCLYQWLLYFCCYHPPQVFCTAAQAVHCIVTVYMTISTVA